jgi:ubiquinol-cytochrome c reductase cytochrome c subunit
MKLQSIATLALATGVAALLTTSAAFAQSTPAPAALAAGDATRGKANFLKYGCYECHGTVGQGNYTAAVRLAPHPLPLGAILNYIRKPAGEMPSYSTAILPDKDVADIWAYLASIPVGKTAAQIPALSGVTTKPK